MLVSLPIFNVGMSIATIYMGGITLVFFLTQKLIFKKSVLGTNNPFKNKVVWMIMSIYFLHLIGLLYTDDISYALHDLKTKVPLLVIPFMLAYLPVLTKKEVKVLLGFFVAAVLFSVLSSLCVYWGIVQKDFHDVRKITVLFISKISHIRLSLLVVFSMVVLIYYYNKKEIKWYHLLMIILPMIYFLYVIQSITGILIFGSLVALYIFKKILEIKNNNNRLAYATIYLASIAGVSLLLLSYVNNYFWVDDPIHNLEMTTPRGNPYDHNVNYKVIENHHYIWYYVCWGELNAAWNKRSDVAFDGQDKNGQIIYGTLIRYMASKGLRKDQDGMAQLTEEDIRKVENGQTSIVQDHKSPILYRLDGIIAEFNKYLNGGNPSGNSVTQRIEFWKAAKEIIKENPMLGVGTGDVENEFQNQYEIMNSLLEEKYRLRAHNQYLTIAVTFGLAGLIWFLVVLIFPLKFKENRRNFLFMGFFVIMMLSFLAEDTLETQAGVTLVSFFMPFLLIQLQKELNE